MTNKINKEFTSDHVLGLPDNPVKYFGHGRTYPKARYENSKIIFDQPIKISNEQRNCKATPAKD